MNAVINYYRPEAITGRWGDPRPNGRIHEGVDYSHSRTPGTIDIPALRSGRVVAIWTPSDRHGYGHRVDTSTDAGIVSYAHLHSPSPYRIGQAVAQGAIVGQEGRSGFTSGPCVHVEHAVNGIKRNPATVIAETLADLAGLPSRPFPESPEEPIQEEEEMKTTGIYWTRKSDGETMCALITPGSGFVSVWQGGGGAYNSAIATGFDTGSFVQVSESHATALVRDATALRDPNVTVHAAPVVDPDELS